MTTHVNHITPGKGEKEWCPVKTLTNLEDPKWFEEFMQLPLKERLDMLHSYVVKPSIARNEQETEEYKEFTKFIGVTFGDGTDAAIERAFGKDFLTGNNFGVDYYIDTTWHYIQAKPFMILGDDFFRRLLDSQYHITWAMLDYLTHSHYECQPDPDGDQYRVECVETVRRLLLTKEGQKVTVELIRRYDGSEFCSLIENYLSFSDATTDNLRQIRDFFVAAVASKELKDLSVREEIDLLSKFV